MDIQLSVIIPVYQVENYLSRCIESVLVQDYDSYEIILVDDGSTDSSPIICDDYAQQFEHISVIHKENGGLSDARNVGIQHAKGKYIFFLDSDDWIIKTMFNDMKDIILSSNYDIIQFGVQKVYTEADIRRGYLFKEHLFIGHESLESMLRSQEITSFSTDKLYRKELFVVNDIEFPKNAYYEDLGTIYKLLLVSQKVYYTNQIYYCYFMKNENAITKTWSDKKFKDMFRFFQDIYHVSTKVLDDDNRISKAYYNNGLVYLLMKLYEENKEDSKVCKTILRELKLYRISPLQLKGYPNYIKYLFYRLHILKLSAKIKILIKNRQGQ